jgi:aspartyl-tRNA(Asn)/glutamyl-tRNA(Gln) amidotransferase subunit C
MSTISIEDVRHVARLARISMDDDRLASMTGELQSILESIGQIGELDLKDVEPTTHALEVVNVMADDVPHTELTPEAALANAPAPADGAFRVPRMES